MATLSQVGIAGVGYGVLMPKLKNRWRLEFAGIGGGAFGTDLSMQVITTTRPSLSFEPIQLDRYNSKVFVVGKHTWETLAVTVEDDVTNLATEVIQAQLEMQQRLIGASGPWLNTEATANTYKFGTVLTMLGGNEEVTEVWKLEGCSLMAVNWQDLDYQASESVKIDLTIQYDHARQELIYSVQGSAIGGLLL